MRIIAGKFKGRKLVSFEASHIRPTTDRIKENLFNILGSSIDRARVLDIFSGTGNLGLEALSRGAAHVTFLESSRRSIDIIRRNCALLEVKSEVELVARDAFKFLKDYQGEPWDIVMVDPPFTEKWATRCLEAISESAVFGPETVVTMEKPKKESTPETVGNLHCVDTRNYGDKILAFYRWKDVR